MKRKSFSIKYRVIAWIFALLIPSVVLLSVFAIFQVNQTYEQLISSEQTNLRLLATRVNDELNDVEEYLYETALENRVFRSMADLKDETFLYGAAFDVLNSDDGVFEDNEGLAFITIYSEANAFYAYKDSGLEYLGVSEKVEMRKAVQTRMQRFFLVGNSPNRKWFTVEIAEKWFLCRVVRYREMYCAALFDIERLSNSFSNSLKQGVTLAFREENQLLNNIDEDWIPDNWDKQMVRIEDGSRHILLNEQVGDITMTYLFKYQGIIGRMGLAMFLVLAIAIIVVVAIPIFYRQLKKDFFQPLDKLVGTMRQIRDGEENLITEDDTCEEFKEVNVTFNQMIEQIRSLRIEQYEKALETQKAQLSFLQAQIRPHFYLNCLKVIYALVQQGQYEDIKKCILLVSKHLRYAMRSNSNMLPIRVELDYCENYVELWAVMNGMNPELSIDVEPELIETMIPQISLLSLVENSIRVNQGLCDELKIRIRGRKIVTEEGPMMCLSVHDDGCGFTREKLDYLNGDEWMSQDTEHVGLQNVVRRFKTLYSDKFQVAFINKDGALVEFYFPL